VNQLTTRERPTLGALAVAFVVALLTWLRDLLPAGIPDEVVTSGYALACFAVAVLVGQAVSKLGERAPWAADTHKAVTAYALLRNPDDHPAEVDAANGLLQQLGLASLDEARQLIGLDPETDA
jgi:hypothetical protein